MRVFALDQEKFGYAKKSLDTTVENTEEKNSTQDLVDIKFWYGHTQISVNTTRNQASTFL